jgi:hypothetical protein
MLTFPGRFEHWHCVIGIGIGEQYSFCQALPDKACELSTVHCTVQYSIRNYSVKFKFKILSTQIIEEGRAASKSPH